MEKFKTIFAQRWIAILTAFAMFFIGICFLVKSISMLVELNDAYDNSLRINSEGNIYGQKFVRDTLRDGYFCDLFMNVSFTLFTISALTLAICFVVPTRDIKNTEKSSVDYSQANGHEITDRA